MALGEKINKLNAFITDRSIKALAPALIGHVLEIVYGNGEHSMPIVEAIGSREHFTGVERSLLLVQQTITRFSCDDTSQASILADTCHSVCIEKNTLDGALAVNLLYYIDDISFFSKRSMAG